MRSGKNTSRGRKLGDSDIQELFDRHVATRDIESSMRVRARIQKVVEEVTAATKYACVDVGRYNNGLGAYQNRLRRDSSVENIAELVHGLLADTTIVLGSTSDLQQTCSTAPSWRCACTPRLRPWRVVRRSSIRSPACSIDVGSSIR